MDSSSCHFLSRFVVLLLVDLSLVSTSAGALEVMHCSVQIVSQPLFHVNHLWDILFMVWCCDFLWTNNEGTSFSSFMSCSLVSEIVLFSAPLNKMYLVSINKPHFVKTLTWDWNYASEEWLSEDLYLQCLKYSSPADSRALPPWLSIWAGWLPRGELILRASSVHAKQCSLLSYSERHIHLCLCSSMA